MFSQSHKFMCFNQYALPLYLKQYRLAIIDF